MMSTWRLLSGTGDQQLSNTTLDKLDTLYLHTYLFTDNGHQMSPLKMWYPIHLSFRTRFSIYQVLKIYKCLQSLSCGGVSNMLLVLSITFHCRYYIWGCMCSTGPFQLMWLTGYIHNSCYYHHQIGSISLTHYHIFPWLCAWGVCHFIFCHLFHIHSWKTGIFFHYYCTIYDGWK